MHVNIDETGHHIEPAHIYHLLCFFRGKILSHRHDLALRDRYVAHRADIILRVDQMTALEQQFIGFLSSRAPQTHQQQDHPSHHSHHG